ncbi:MAG: DUF4363 family protein [Eubacterium sp.]|nr:DUF4363 family protein [Eubacterium sp.]
MKRLYIAILFLAVAISLCIFEQYTVTSAYKEATQYLNTAIEEVKKEDYKSAKETCENLSSYWSEKQKFMTAMIDHGALDDTSITIYALADLAENESDDLENELITAKNQIKSIHDNQKITFGNVF